MEFSSAGRELLETLIFLYKGRSTHYQKLYVLFSFPYESLHEELSKIGLSSCIYTHKGSTKSSGRYHVCNKSLFLAYIEKNFPRHYMLLLEQEVKDL